MVTETTEEGPRPKTFLVITDKGKLVAEKIKEIQDLLESDIFVVLINQQLK